MSSTPALRGFAGGPGLPENPAGEAPAADSRARGASPWQRAQHAWQAAGVDWVREPGWLPEPAWSDAARRHRFGGPQQAKPVGADWDHTEPIPAVPGAGRGGPGRRGPGRRRPAAGRWAAAGGRAAPGRAAPRQAGWPPAPGRKTGGTSGAARRGMRRLTDPVIAGPLIAGIAVTALAVSIGVLVLTRQPAAPARAAGLLPGYPPARLADATFAAGTQARPALLPALTAVAADGQTVVAAGSQSGPPWRRPVILTSADGGATWRLASLQAPGGDVTGAAVPVLLAGGPGGWLALGSQASWTSATGQVWHQRPGIGLRRGDRVLGLARTSTGFLAVGMNTPLAGPARSRGVLWSSADGMAWQRSPAPRLGLRRGNVVTALEQVAVRGDTIMITGAAAPAGAEGPRGRTAAPPAPAQAWRSADGGATWMPVRLPAGHGSAGLIGGVAATRGGFVLIRPGRGPSGRSDAVAYRSADGFSWQFATVLAGARHTALHIIGVSGNGNGAVLTATETAGRRAVNVALVTGTGRSWHRALLPGGAAAGRVAGAAAGPGGSVVAAGSALTPAGSTGSGAARARQPFLLLAGTRYAFVGQQALARAATAGVTVTALATAGGRQVAVGSANGGPVIWTAPPGGRWSADPPGTWATPGLTLTSVTHGSAGWLAVGQAVRRGQARLVLLTSRDAVTWQAVAGLRRLASPGIQLTQAAATRDGYVLVGQRAVAGRTAAVAWWSATSAAWSQAAGTTVAPATGQQGAPATGQPGRHPAPQPSRMLAVTTGGPGYVAVGALGGQPVVWVSADGRSWASAALPGPAGAGSALLRGVAAHGQRVAAIGTELTAAGQVPFAAVSRDAGRTWREFRLPLPACQPGEGTSAGGLGGSGVSAIVAAGSGFVATGTCGSAGRADVVVWSSADGRTWTAASPHTPGLSGPGAQQITSLTASGRWLTGAGYTATLAGEHPTLWRLRVR